MLLGARLGMSGGGAAPLPYDAEVEYLESTGTSWQYIATGIIPDATTGLSLDFTFLDQKDVPVFGCRQDSGNTRFFIGHNASNSLYVADGGIIYPAGRGDMFGGDIGVSMNYLNDRKIKATVDGQSYETSFPSVTWTNTKEIWLFTAQWYTSSYYAVGRERVRSAKISKGSEIVLDLIPVRVGTVGYMYDRAHPFGGPLGNGLYPNKGTGSFVLGPDK